MKSLTQFVVAICCMLALGSSAAIAQSIATSYSWTSTGPIISPKSDSTHNIVAVKDPSAVLYNGQWIVYASYATSSGGYGMEYLNIGSNWSNASAATPYFMDNTSGFSGYHT
ncbi:MAG: non-reducing end alpha-L-arabinofuranosidase family hydrolase, partial [Terracidiphilus sp.]